MSGEHLARLRLFGEAAQTSARDLAGWAVPLARDLARRGAAGLGAAAARVRTAVESWGKSESSPDQEEPLRAWRRDARRHFVTVAAFSLFVNLLMLTLPIYLFQISDRVLTSRSFDTLLMLSLLALVFLTVLSLLDVFRRQVLGSLATRLDTRLGGPLLASVISSSAAGSGGAQTLRSLHQVRNFISSPAMLLLFDTPLAPVYLAVVFLISPVLGFIVLAAGILLIGIAWLNQHATSAHLALAGAHAIKADQHAEALARNSQVINAMGMLNESILHWGREEASALTRQAAALDRNFWISGLSKYFRLITQIAVLGIGAYLALEGKLTAGMMIAASIIAARGLQPLEGMIEGWRSIVQTRVSYARASGRADTGDRSSESQRCPCEERLRILQHAPL